MSVKYKFLKKAPALFLSGSLVFALSALGSEQAFAKSCDPTDNDIQAAQMAVTKINSRINTLELNLVQTLKLHAGQISAYITQQTTAIGRMFDAQNQSNAQIAREEAQIEATRDFLPSSNACETVSGLIGISAARQHAQRTATDTTTAQINRLANTQGTPAQNGQAPDVAIRWNRRVETWCSPKDIADGKGICSGLSENHNADINPSSLFGKRTLETSLEQQAARDFITNLTTPLAPDPLPLRDLNSDEDRRRHIKRLSAQSRIGLANSALNNVYAERLPSVNLGEWARAALPEAENIPDNISWKELEAILMREKYENPNYHISLQAMEPANLQRELASQQALMLSLLYKVSESIELQTSLQATRLAMEAEKALTPTIGDGPAIGNGSTFSYPGTIRDSPAATGGSDSGDGQTSPTSSFDSE
ncbi:hypothetical protein [Kiloniella sp.]|uniref:hypothetical protein n=1 Tax=Kiloniella sp. TaxID=1938587 RepID=UPI003B0124AC